MPESSRFLETFSANNFDLSDVDHISGPWNRRSTADLLLLRTEYNKRE